MTIEVIAEPKIYDDPSLPMIVQGVDFYTLWGVKPTVEDFGTRLTNKRNFDKFDWLEQFRELDRRRELKAWADKKGIMINDLTDLPGAYLQGNFANIIYNEQVPIREVMPSRINHTLSGALYCFPGLWITYQHLNFLKDKYEKMTDHGSRNYRIVVIEKMQDCIGLGLKNILEMNPELNTGRSIIVNTTDSLSERSTLYCDAKRLYEWVSLGHTLDELCVGWIMEQRNPTI